MRRSVCRSYAATPPSPAPCSKTWRGRTAAGLRCCAKPPNVRAIHAAVGNMPGMMKIPNPNYLAPASFGSLELKRREGTEFIGQTIDYAEARMVEVRAITLDAFNFPRLDLIKMDVEGMELEALAGATKSIQAHRPLMLIEALKVDAGKLRRWLEALDYSVLQSGINLLAIHKQDECLKHLKIEQPA
jgi:FkbM family methyltransferase